MSWQQQQQQQGYGYDGYGNYNDQSYGTGGQGGYDNVSYDMFAGQGQDQGQQGYQQQPSYYDPNAFQQESSQTHKRSHTPHQNPQQGSQGSGFSSGASAAAQMMMNPNEMLANPLVTDMAMQYGQNIMGQGKEELKKNLDKYISIGQLKYYFAVDTNYVGKKLALLLFPFAQSDWSVKYNQEEPVQPKFDINAPDLYIPCMSYMTYILLVGYILGIRNAFSPDLLASTASSSLVWLILELVVIYLTLTIMSINTSLTKWDILSFSTYKYVGMIVILISGLLSQSKAIYHGSLAYVAAALAFFLLRTLKLRIEPEVHGMQQHGKRKLYMILLYAGLQPLLMWWLTSYLVPISTATNIPLPDKPIVP